MMKLCYKDIEKVMVLDGITPYVINVLSPHEFYKIVNLLNTQTASRYEDGFVLSDPETLKELSLKKHGDILIDFFNMEFNNRKIQNAIYAKAVEIVNNTNIKDDYIRSLESITQLINKIIVELDVQTTSEVTLSPIDIVKLGNLKVLEWYKNPLEMIVNYINLMTNLENIDILFLVNASQILNREELKKLFKHCAYIKLNLVLIESKPHFEKIQNEQIIEIDNDLCEIDY